MHAFINTSSALHVCILRGLIKINKLNFIDAVEAGGLSAAAGYSNSIYVNFMQNEHVFNIWATRSS